ncbi:MAG: hypothetical protein NTV21_02035 [Planctomycetota bacterium]|nr:hypothetical protein [Planctomycetota bacterium]
MRRLPSPGAPLAACTAVLLALALGACQDDPPPTPDATASAPKFEPGVAFAVDNEPIHAYEVDRITVYVERIDPAAAPAHLRRLALTNVALPRAVARVMAPQAHAMAKAEAQALREQLSSGSYAGPVGPDGTIGEVGEGGWSELGIEPWGVAMDLAEGQWSDVIEEVGQFLVLRRLERHDGPVPTATRVKIEAFRFPWLPLETLKADVDAAYDSHRLVVVDPAWADYVPTVTQHRMKGKKP